VPIKDSFVYDKANEAGLGIIESKLGRPPALYYTRLEGKDVVGTGYL
jgi:hypothetical protein